MNCLSLADIDNNLGCNGNAPGIVQSVIFGYCEDVATWPTKPVAVDAGGETTPLTLEQAGVLVGDIVMKEGKRAFTFDFTEETGSLAVAPGGQADSTNFTYTLTLVKAQINKKIFGFMNAALSKKVFMIVKDENGVWYLLGNDRRGVTMGGEGSTTGTTGEDRNHTTLTFTYRSGMALVYEGDTEDILTETP